MGLLRLIGELLLFWFVLRLLIRLFMPFIVTKVVRNANEKMNEQARRREGKITIDYIPPQKKSKHSSAEGEFTDYTEVN